MTTIALNENEYTVLDAAGIAHENDQRNGHLHPGWRSAESLTDDYSAAYDDDLQTLVSLGLLETADFFGLEYRITSAGLHALSTASGGKRRTIYRAYLCWRAGAAPVEMWMYSAFTEAEAERWFAANPAGRRGRQRIRRRDVQARMCVEIPEAEVDWSRSPGVLLITGLSG